MEYDQILLYSQATQVIAGYAKKFGWLAQKGYGRQALIGQ